MGRLVAGLGVGQIVSWGVLWYALPVLLSPLERDLGWSRELLVGGLTTAVVVSALLAPLVGRTLDRVEPRRVLVGGSALATAAVVGWSTVAHPAAYYLVWALMGVAMSLVLYEPAFTVLVKWCGERAGRAITGLTLFGALASTLFQPLIGALVPRLGWRATVLVLAVILGAITIPVHAVLLRDPPAAAASATTATPFRDRRLWWLTATFTAEAAATTAAAVLLITYLVDRGWSLAAAAAAGGTLGAMQLPGRLAFAGMAEWVPRVVLAPFLLALPGAGIAVVAFSNGSATVWAGVVLLGVGQGTATVLRARLLADLWGPARYGVISGASGTPSTLVRAAAPLAATALVSATGTYALPFALLASLSMGAAGLGWLALRSGVADAHPEANA